MSASVTGVLLAGGQSRRMGGGDKCLLPFAGSTMLQRIIDVVRPQVSGLVINANGDAARFSSFGLPVVADPIEGFAGPLAGVLAGLRWLQTQGPDNGSAIVTVPTDAPFLPDDLVRRLIEAQDGHTARIVLATSGGRTHPVCGLWPAALADDLETALAGGTRKVLDWTERHDTVITSFTARQIGEAEVDPFFNANRQADLAEAEALIERLPN